MPDDRSVFVETRFPVWAIEQNPRPEDAEKARQAQALYENWCENGSTIMISSITVAEFLAKIPDSCREEYLSEFQTNFMIVQFDAYAAELASGVQFNEWGDLKQEYHSRDHLKADILILGCVLAAKPSVFYTEDDRFCRLAKKYFPNAESLPQPPPKQGNLFNENGS